MESEDLHHVKYLMDWCNSKKATMTYLYFVIIFHYFSFFSVCFYWCEIGLVELPAQLRM